MNADIHILYIGNKLSRHGFTPTGIEYIGPLLESGRYRVSYASDRRQPFFRLVEMLWSVVKHRRSARLVLIDTYSSSAFYYSVMCAALARLFGLPYIPILHGGDLPSRMRRSPHLTKNLLGGAIRTVAVSNYLLHAFKSLGHLVCVPNPLPLRNYRFRERKTLRPRLLWVRSFHETYNPVLAVEVLHLLRQKHDDAVLCMVGPDKDGSLEKVSRRAGKLSLHDRVELPGKLTKQEWISRSEFYDIFINTTNFDNMPVSVIEAMALGLPVVSTNVGGLPHLIENGHDGLLVAPESAVGFAEAIEKLLADPSLGVRLAQAARKKVEEFDEHRVLEKWNEVIHEAIQPLS